MDHPPRRPGSVLTAAILLIVFGAFLLMCGICGGAGLAVAGPANAGGPEEILAKDLPGHQIIDIGNVIANLLIGLAMILAGVGVLNLMPIARYAAYVVVVFHLLKSVGQAAYGAIFIVPVMEKIVAQQAPNQQQAPFDIGKVMAGGMWFGIALGLIIPLAFCVPIIILLSVRSARAAFSGARDADEPRDEDERRPRYGGYDDDDDYSPPKKPPTAPGDTGITDRS